MDDAPKSLKKGEINLCSLNTTSWHVGRLHPIYVSNHCFRMKHLARVICRLDDGEVHVTPPLPQTVSSVRDRTKYSAAIRENLRDFLY